MQLHQLGQASATDLSLAGQPDWLTRLREEALHQLRVHPAPASGQERWRFTDLSLLAPEQFRLGGATPRK